MRAVLKGIELEVVVNFLGSKWSNLELDFQLFNRAVRQYMFISSARPVYAKPPARLPLSEEMPMGNAWWEYGRKK